MTDEQLIASVTTLRDGRSVVIRPLAEDDKAALLAFGQSLPQDDWMYLEDDLQSPEIITRLTNATHAENWRQIVACDDHGIVGYGAARKLHGWSSHVADLQLVVASSYRRAGLGTALARAIFDAAGSLRVTKLITEMLAAQTGGRAIFRHLGFHVEGTLHHHACDRFGNCHDLVILAYHMK